MSSLIKNTEKNSFKQIIIFVWWVFFDIFKGGFVKHIWCILFINIKSLHYSPSKGFGGSRQHLAASAPRKGHWQRFFGAMLPWTPSAMVSTEIYEMGVWTKTKLMCWQLLILMNENCWWFKNSLYIHFLKPHQTTSFHLWAAFGPSVFHGLSLLSVFVLMWWRTVCSSPHAVTDRGWCGGGLRPRCSYGGGLWLQGFLMTKMQILLFDESMINKNSALFV